MGYYLIVLFSFVWICGCQIPWDIIVPVEKAFFLSTFSPQNIWAVNCAIRLYDDAIDILVWNLDELNIINETLENLTLGLNELWRTNNATLKTAYIEQTYNNVLTIYFSTRFFSILNPVIDPLISSAFQIDFIGIFQPLPDRIVYVMELNLNSSTWEENIFTEARSLIEEIFYVSFTVPTGLYGYSYNVSVDSSNHENVTEDIIVDVPSTCSLPMPFYGVFCNNNNEWISTGSVFVNYPDQILSQSPTIHSGDLNVNSTVIVQNSTLNATNLIFHNNSSMKTTNANLTSKYIYLESNSSLILNSTSLVVDKLVVNGLMATNVFNAWKPMKIGSFEGNGTLSISMNPPVSGAIIAELNCTNVESFPQITFGDVEESPCGAAVHSYEVQVVGQQLVLVENSCVDTQRPNYLLLGVLIGCVGLVVIVGVMVERLRPFSEIVFPFRRQKTEI